MTYQAFGARIESPIPLSLPLATDNPELRATINIVLGSVEMPYDGDGCLHRVGNIQYFARGERVAIFVPRAGEIEVLSDTLLHIQPLEGEPQGLLAAYITGFAFLFILKRRGFITFHGSAVSDGRNAFLILGKKGGGKSTTAAALSLEGFTSYSDDLSLVSPKGEVYPGNPIARLLPDTHETLFGAVESSGDDFDGIEKREYQLSAEMSPRKLGCIFVLKLVDADRLMVAQVRGAAKATAVFPHFSALPGLDTPAALIALAEACIKNVPLYILGRPAAGDSLKEVVAAIKKVARNTER